MSKASHPKVTATLSMTTEHLPGACLKPSLPKATWYLLRARLYKACFLVFWVLQSERA